MLTEAALASHTRSNARTVNSPRVHRTTSAAPTPTAGMNRARSRLPVAITPGLTLSQQLTFTAPAPANDGPRVSGSETISRDVEEFLSSVGKGDVDSQEHVYSIYQFTGRANWLVELQVQLGLNAGTAKALVSLLCDM